MPPSAQSVSLPLCSAVMTAPDSLLSPRRWFTFAFTLAILSLSFSLSLSLSLAIVVFSSLPAEMCFSVRSRPATQSSRSSSSASTVTSASPKVPFYMILSNYLCHGTLFLFGHLNDFLRRHGIMASLEKVERNRDGYNGLFSSFATFYIRNIIHRLIDMWCHPISSVPGAVIDILERKYGPYNATWKLVSK